MTDHGAAVETNFLSIMHGYLLKIAVTFSCYLLKTMVTSGCYLLKKSGHIWLISTEDSG